MINPLMKCWIVDDISLSNNDSVISMVYLILRLEIPKIFCMSTPLFGIGLIGLEVSDLAQLVIESVS